MPKVMSDAEILQARERIVSEIERLKGQLADVGDPGCTGEGTCHGCLGWCRECGEVSRVCDAGPSGCHWHYPINADGEQPSEPDANLRFEA